MRFVLFEKLAELEGKELALLIIAAVVAVGLIVALAVVAARRLKRAKAGEGTAQAGLQPGSSKRLRALVYGALCVSLSFMLSYIKLFCMPMGGSITLCSMLPIVVYGYWYGPARGFLAALAYSVLQVIQGAWIVHWAQFILDYFVAFCCLGLGSLFPRRLPLGMAVAGIARMACSVLSGVVFFAESAIEAGYSSALAYSLAYNGSTIGVDTAICVVVALLPPVAALFKNLSPNPRIPCGQ